MISGCDHQCAHDYLPVLWRPRTTASGKLCASRPVSATQWLLRNTPLFLRFETLKGANRVLSRTVMCRNRSYFERPFQFSAWLSLSHQLEYTGLEYSDDAAQETSFTYNLLSDDSHNFSLWLHQLGLSQAGFLPCIYLHVPLILDFPCFFTLLTLAGPGPVDSIASNERWSTGRRSAEHSSPSQILQSLLSGLDN